MKPLYTEKTFSQARGNDLMPLSCYFCTNTFFLTKTYIKSILQRKRGKCKYCSKQCYDKSKIKSIAKPCGQCGKTVIRPPKEIKRSKSNYVFCNRSCAAKYNNTHKNIGYRRSKIEIWIEKQLKILYPNLNILFNDKNTINSELDIYIPSLSLAFELNGIFHYEPIYGLDKLNQIKHNDQNKFYLCQRHNIDLCIIDISGMVHFKPNKAQKFLDIICDLISNHSQYTPGRT